MGSENYVRQINLSGMGLETHIRLINLPMMGIGKQIVGKLIPIMGRTQGFGNASGARVPEANVSKRWLEVVAN